MMEDEMPVKIDQPTVTAAVYVTYAILRRK
jgi:hypothetical protein